MGFLSADLLSTSNVFVRSSYTAVVSICSHWSITEVLDLQFPGWFPSPFKSRILILAKYYILNHWWDGDSDRARVQDVILCRRVPVKR